jgi:Mg-chelatase subunit ChlI
MTPKRPVYPCAALVGQERLKLALILNAINPLIGGVLIRGVKGTAKSTAARGEAAAL